MTNIFVNHVSETCSEVKCIHGFKGTPRGSQGIPSIFKNSPNQLRTKVKEFLTELLLELHDFVSLYQMKNLTQPFEKLLLLLATQYLSSTEEIIRWINWPEFHYFTNLAPFCDYVHG